jgi:hypothetical protein
MNPNLVFHGGLNKVSTLSNPGWVIFKLRVSKCRYQIINKLVLADELLDSFSHLELTWRHHFSNPVIK